MSGWQHADVWDVVAEVRAGAAALVHGDRRVSWAALRDRAALSTTNTRSVDDVRGRSTSR